MRAYYKRGGRIKGKGMKGMSVKSGDKRPTKSGAGMTAKGVAKYRRNNPGSKLQTAVTEKKPPKAAKDPNSRLRQARRRWRC